MSRHPSFTTFAERVGKLRLTDGQRALCSVVYDGLEPYELPAHLHDAAVEIFGTLGAIPATARSVLVLCCGRYSGKTSLGVLRLLHRALTADLSMLSSGEPAYSVLVAPDLRTAKHGLQLLRGFVESQPTLARMKCADTQTNIDLRREDGSTVRFEVFPATSGGASVRGRSLLDAFFDEAAFFRSSDASANLHEMFSAAAPRILPGGQLIVSSTPYAGSGLFFDLFNQNHGNPVTALACRAPTLVMRGEDRHVGDMIVREQRRDPMNAAREFECEFVSIGTDAFFDPAMIDEAVYDGALPPGLHHGCGCDFAFVRDHSALVVTRLSGDLLFYVAEAAELAPSPKQPLVPSQVVEAFAARVRIYGCSHVRCDAHYREAIREHLQRHKLRLVPAAGDAKGKAEEFLRVRSLMYEGRIRIHRQHARLIEQLKRVVSKPTESGYLQIDSPRRRGIGGDGGHGDIASAFILSVLDAETRARPGRTAAIGAPSEAARAFGFARDNEPRRQIEIDQRTGTARSVPYRYRSPINGGGF